VEKDRGVKVTVTRESKHKGLNWDVLRAKVAKGMRNATLLATAPNANIGLIAATTPGFDPRFAQVFSRNKISGKYLDINHNLVKDLKNLGLWEKVKGDIIEFQGDISGIESIPQYIKDIYKTSFSTSPYAFIEVAARAQKWIDQGISRNMYLSTRDIDDIMKIYMSAWEKGVKTTYYLHMKPQHTAEQSTVSVNKSAVMGKLGFGALKKATASTADTSAPAPVDAISTSTYTVTEDESELTANSAPETMGVQEPIPSPAELVSEVMQEMQNKVPVATIPKATVTVDMSSASSSSSAQSIPKYQSLSDLRMQMNQEIPVEAEVSAYAPAVSMATATVSTAPAASVVQSANSSTTPMAPAKGFAARPKVIMSANKTCPSDPAELAQCDSCQ
jgi:ribonucleoside-diphosphate reductase alpha chain